jgi:preprotein translocase subunit SecE
MVAKQTTSTPQSTTGARPRAATAGAGSRTGSSDLTARRVGAPSLLTFFQESRAELRKVTWPTREQTLNLTLAVIAMTVIVAAFLGIVNGILNYIIQPLVGA